MRLTVVIRIPISGALVVGVPTTAVSSKYSTKAKRALCPPLDLNIQLLTDALE